MSLPKEIQKVHNTYAKHRSVVWFFPREMKITLKARALWTQANFQSKDEVVFRNNLPSINNEIQFSLAY